MKVVTVTGKKVIELPQGGRDNRPIRILYPRVQPD